jgi:DNA mismatch endonuclease, patch repair protein
MVDVFTKEVRSRVMSAIRSRGNKETELRFARILRQAGIVGWRRHQRLTGRPDFLFPKARVVLFIDGCFWHGCPQHGQKPRSNKAYWLPKLIANQTRDRRVSRELRALGWKVVRVWEHELNDVDRLIKRLSRALG